MPFSGHQRINKTMSKKLVKHALQCLHCNFQKIHEDYDSHIERDLISEARQHAKETEHTIMVQS